MPRSPWGNIPLPQALSSGPRDSSRGSKINTASDVSVALSTATDRWLLGIDDCMTADEHGVATDRREKGISLAAGWVLHHGMEDGHVHCPMRIAETADCERSSAGREERSL